MRPWWRWRVVLPLRAWLALSHLAVLALPLLAVLGTGALAVELREQTRHELEVQGELIGLHVLAALDGGELAALGPSLTPWLTEARTRTLAGVRLVDRHGVVVASSGAELGANLVGRPEVAAALEGGGGYAERPRKPAREPLNSESRRARVRLFVAMPLVEDGAVVGAVVLSRTPREELQALYKFAPGRMALGVSLTLLSTALLVLWTGHLFTRSLMLLATGSRRFADSPAEGLVDLQRPVRSHVAEVRALAGAVRRMADRLQERVAYISEFAGNVSHEFKTPLSTLRGTVELLADEDDMDPEQRARFLDNALDEVDRLERLVSGLLELARAEESGNVEAIDLQALAESVAGRYAEVEVGGRAVVVTGQRAQLDSALANLVHNALQHGGGTCRVEGWVEGRWTGLDVTDDGPGISAANQARVFERFFTTGRERGRTGLGLALVRTVCATHGGEAELVESQPGRTVLRMRLPRAEG